MKHRIGGPAAAAAALLTSSSTGTVVLVMVGFLGAAYSVVTVVSFIVTNTVRSIILSLRFDDR